MCIRESLADESHSQEVDRGNQAGQRRRCSRNKLQTLQHAQSLTVMSDPLGSAGLTPHKWFAMLIAAVE